MSNILTIPASGSIYFDSGTAGSSTVPDLTGSTVSLSYNGDAGLNITSYNALSADRFSVDGGNGRLFSISDSLTGTIFSVNDAAGLPIIEVESDTVDTVTIGTYSTNALVVKDDKVGIGTNTPNEKLTVSGNISATGSLSASSATITGNLIVGTDTLYVDSVNGIVNINAPAGVNHTTTLAVKNTNQLVGIDAAQVEVWGQNYARFIGKDANGTQKFNFGYNSNAGDIATMGYGGGSAYRSNAAHRVTLGHAASQNTFAGQVTIEGSTSYLTTPNLVLQNNSAGTQTADFLQLRDQNDTAFSVIDINGNLGLNTSSPTAKLDVNGTVNVNDDATLNGTENTMPNQTLDGGDASVLTYGLAKGYDPLAYSTLTAPSSSVGYLPFGFGRIDGTYTHNWGTNNPPAYFLPFIIRGEFAKCSFDHNAGTHPTAVMEVAVYNAGSDGKPTTLIDQQTVSLSSTGLKTVTFTSPISVDGLFYAALRPSIGKTEWDSTGGSGTLQVRGYLTGSNPFLSQILGSIDPSTFDLYDGTMIFRYTSYTHPFPSDLTGDGSVTLVQIADSPLYTVLLHS